MTSASILIRCGWAAVVAALAVTRLLGVMDNRFQALAHLVAGGFLGAYALGRSSPRFLDVGFYGWGALALAAVEAFAFLQGIGRVDGR